MNLPWRSRASSAHTRYEMQIARGRSEPSAEVVRVLKGVVNCKFAVAAVKPLRKSRVECSNVW